MSRTDSGPVKVFPALEDSNFQLRLDAGTRPSLDQIFILRFSAGFIPSHAPDLYFVSVCSYCFLQLASNE